MYPYHNVIRKRIKNGELIGVEKTGGEYAVILYFKTFPFRRPIKESSLWRYKDLLEKYGI